MERLIASLYQGEEERLTYEVDVTNWGNTPTNPEVKVFDVTAENQRDDVSATVLTGTATIDGNIIKTPTVHSLTPGSRYRVEVKFTLDGNVYEPYFYIDAEY